MTPPPATFLMEPRFLSRTELRAGAEGLSIFLRCPVRQNNVRCLLIGNTDVVYIEQGPVRGGGAEVKQTTH